MKLSGSGKRDPRPSRRRGAFVVMLLLTLALVGMPLQGSARSLAPRSKTVGVQPTVAEQSKLSLSDPVDSILVDIDGDRILDIVEALSGGGLSMRAGITRDTFRDPVVFGPAVKANRVQAVDVTSDGLDDIVAYQEGGFVLWVVPSAGAAGFGAVRTVSLDTSIQSVAFADFDRNGGVDVAIATASTDLVILKNKDDRSGFETVAISLPGQTISVATVRLRFDLSIDLSVGLAGGSILTLTNTAGDFRVTQTTHVPFDPELMVSGDIDLDGVADIVAASKTGVFAYLHRETNKLGDPVVTPNDSPLSRIQLGFVDNDGVVDLVGLSIGMPVLFSGAGQGQFLPARQLGESVQVSSLTLTSSRRANDVKLLVSTHSGSRIESIGRASARGGSNVILVTNTRDIGFNCDPMGGAVTQIPAPPGSLRDAVEVVAPSTGGSDVIRFQIPTSDIQFNTGTKVWYIALAQALVVTDPGLVIDGNSQTDTNPFGPEIALVPLDLTPTLMMDQPLPVFDGIVVSGGASGCEINGLIISNISPNLVGSFSLGTCYPVGAFPVGMQFLNLIRVDGSGNSISGNYLGTDEHALSGSTGTTFSTFLANAGVLLVGNGNTVGGDTTFDRNIITYVEDGVRVFGATGNQILGNVIGTDGAVGSRNGEGSPSSGVLLVGASNTTIGSNVISGNGGAGASSGILAIEGDTGPTTGTIIARNKLGVDSTNQPITGNNDSGILLNATSSTTIGPGNVIANGQGADGNVAGIQLGGDGSQKVTTGTVISDNEILSNPSGVLVFAGNNNVIGPNNFIHDNNQGVVIANGVSNRITKNSMTNNTFIGINLLSPLDPADTGITPNDIGDTDTGPNTLLNFPKFTGSDASSGQLVVTGSGPSLGIIEIFASDVTHPNGEGVTFLTAVQCSAGGFFSAAIPVPLPVEDGFSITATASDGLGSGNTSEFGPNFRLDRAINISVDTITFPATGVNSTSTVALTICNGGVSDLTLGAFSVTPAGRPFVAGAIPDDGMVLSPGECTSVPISFTPTAEGTFTATLMVASDDPDGPVSISLIGTGVAEVIELSTRLLTVSSTNIGGTRSAFITVTNPTDVPVTVSDVTFTRRGTRKVSFENATDPFFRAAPSTFTVAPRGSQQVQVFFSPDAPRPTTDKKSPFVLPDPSYITPKTVQTNMAFIVNGAAETVLIKAKVSPKPGITSARIPSTPVVDTLEFTLDIFDPDNNVNNAQFVFYNESFVELFRINDVPGIPNVTKKFVKGINIPITFTFTGVADFARSLKFMDVVAIDASGNQTNTVRFTFVFVNSREGTGGIVMVPVRSGALGLPNPMAPFIGDPDTALPPVNLSPRR